jgi:hypothetical protein
VVSTGVFANGASPYSTLDCVFGAATFVITVFGEDLEIGAY